MAQKTDTAASDAAPKPARLPENVHARAAALTAAIRVRKARGATADGRKHKGRTRAVLVKA
jgi:hypothetical protein